MKFWGWLALALLGIGALIVIGHEMDRQVRINDHIHGHMVH